MPGGEGSGQAEPTSVASEQLLEHLGKLRARLEAGTPDVSGWREGIEVLRQAEQRLRALDAMLSWAREHEATLTVRLAGADMRLADLDSRMRELDSVAQELARSQTARSRAEAAAAEAEQRLREERAELVSTRATLQEVRSKASDLESDLTTLSEELASSTVAWARAERLERERDVAVERARAEAELAMEARLRADDAERHLALYRERFREPDEDEAEAPTAPVVDLAAREELVDLRNFPAEIDRDEAEGDSSDGKIERGYGSEEAMVWGAPLERAGFVGWLRRGILGEDDSEDYPEDDR